MKRGTLGCLLLALLSGAAFVVPLIAPATALLVVLIAAAGLVYLAVSDFHTAFEESRLIRDPVRKCPHCAEPIKVEARVCRWCGRDA